MTNEEHAAHLAAEGMPLYADTTLASQIAAFRSVLTYALDAAEARGAVRALRKAAEKSRGVIEHTGSVFVAVSAESLINEAARIERAGKVE